MTLRLPSWGGAGLGVGGLLTPPLSQAPVAGGSHLGHRDFDAHPPSLSPLDTPSQSESSREAVQKGVPAVPLSLD